MKNNRIDWKALFEHILNEDNYETRISMVEVLTREVTKSMLPRGNAQGEVDAMDMVAFATKELTAALEAARQAACYRKKEEQLNYVGAIVGLLAAYYRTPDRVPTDLMEKIRQYQVIAPMEQFIERELTDAFAEENLPSAELLESILRRVEPLEDEYHRGAFLRGLAYFANRLPRLSSAAKSVLSDYFIAELERCLAAEATTELQREEIELNLEMLSDVSRYVMTDRLASLLAACAARANMTTRYFAVTTLLLCRYPVTDDLLLSLVQDIVHADAIIRTLKDVGMEERVPICYRAPEYMAKSDLVHWLTFPTELGKQPDEIEYLGVVKKRRERYHIFRFRSDSDTLSEELKGQWLIGWAGEDGDTFSQFEEYAKYEKQTSEKTLKYIGKKCL